MTYLNSNQDDVSKRTSIVLIVLNQTNPDEPNHTVIMRFLTSITAMKCPVLLAAGCGAFGGGRAHTADWNSR